MVKGKSEPVPVYKPTKSNANKNNATKSLLWDKIQKKIIKHKNIYGRKNQVTKINEVLDEGKGVIIIEGRSCMVVVLYLLSLL